MGKESWKIDQYFLQISHIIFFVHPLHPQVKSKLCNSVILLLNYTYPGKRFIDIPSSFWVFPLIAKQETDWPFLFCFILFLKYKTQMYSKISRKKYYILANEPYLFMYEYMIIYKSWQILITHLKETLLPLKNMETCTCRGL